jgi:hypothetical protein
MAHIETDPDVIDRWIEEKQKNEQAMLYRLNNLFKGPIPRSKIRRLVRSAFETMCNEATWGVGSAGPVWQALLAEQDLAVWSKLNPPTSIPQFRVLRMLDKLIQGDVAQPRLDCNDFSELIRVIGAWLENGGGLGAPNINVAYRTGVGQTASDSGPSAAYLTYLGDFRRKYGWNYADHLTGGERAELARLATTGDYIQRQDQRDKKLWGKKGESAPRQRSGVPGKKSYDIPAHVADWWVRPKLDKLSGMQMFRVKGDDLCKKIDLLFGLLKGATISGTTTDTAMVLELFGAQHGLHAGYYLFPVGTIAASLHHTLLEAGLALTVVGAIDSYCVGYYTTLISKGGLPGELQEARGILEEAEQDPKNRHFIIWYDKAAERPAGCVLWNKPYELRDARRLVEAKGLMSHVATMPKVPLQQDVARFIRLMAPKLLAYLPQEFQ